jgi:FtsP/CotA-like multicopper oxidase with cupredoxin domain
MDEKKFLRLIGVAGLALMLAVLPWGGDLAFGNAGPAGVTWYANSPSGGGSGTALQKFVDSMPGLGPANANNLGQYIPIAQPIGNALFSDSDYYEIGIQEFTKKVHTNLPKATKFRGYIDLNPAADTNQQYLGPLIVAQRDRPVRIKFSNLLPTGPLFLPVDTTLMGAGQGPFPTEPYYSQNRTSIHNHGAFTPWISDGTPHQWFTPAQETNLYKKGVSFQNVPDMWFDAGGNAVPLGTPGATHDPGPGKQTLYYTNQQSARLMFYHDHAVGITRLNVYAGMAAGYLIHDPVVEDNLISTGVIPTGGGAFSTNPLNVYNWGIPLIIQDKSFVPQDVLTLQDDKWNPAWGTYGDLWFPHIYEANQLSPAQLALDPSGMNPYGRWDFGPWVQPNILAPVEVQAPEIKAAIALPGTDVDHPENYPTSVVPESFMDVMMVNGTVFPFLTVEPKAYRFRILNACNDRFVNLQLYLDASGGGSGATATANVDLVTGQVVSVALVNRGNGYVRPPGIIFTGGGGFGAAAEATLAVNGRISTITLTSPGSGYTSAPTVTIGDTREVKIVPAVPNGFYPATWPKDGRDGGVPDPFTAGPKFIQIGNEGGFLPGVTVRDNQPINYDYDRGSATFGNVQNIEGLDPNVKGVTVFLGPAERADVIVDFSSVAPGTNVILYNDAPAPVPGFQPRYDYYTGNPDLTATGGHTQTQVGVGPNTRTVMQFRVAGTPAAAFNLQALVNALPGAYVQSQPPPIVPQTYYPGAYHSSVDYHATINATSLTYLPLGSTVPRTLEAQQKAIVELFEPYGRMNATLGYEFFEPNANPARSNGVGFAYIDPPDEVFHRGQIQLWKITHNGVDTHPIHIHLNNAQIINRVGWDGVRKPPEPYERGWKETIRMNPLESIFIAQKADLPTVPFNVPDSVRPLNPARQLGDPTGFTNINPKTGVPLELTPTINVLNNFGHEYVWHCHILGHEENDMMRPLKVTGLIPVGSLDLLLLDDG